jgi:predicted Fe-Mo cluster-binding NifX family protein
MGFCAAAALEQLMAQGVRIFAEDGGWVERVVEELSQFTETP